LLCLDPDVHERFVRVDTFKEGAPRFVGAP
jgi:hypothetical protein